MGKKHIDLDLDRCVGCFACVVTCMDQNYDVEEEGPCFRRVVKYEDQQKSQIKYVSIGCMHCEDAPCLFACPTGAIYRDEETGLIQIEREKCIGCHSCLMACPFGTPKFDKDNKMTKCTGCLERVRHGLEPACVQVCPSRALKFEESEGISSNKLKKKLRYSLFEKE